MNTHSTMTHSQAGHLGGIITAIKSHDESFRRYYAAPHFCLQCEKMIAIPEGKTYHHIATKKFCDSSCAATFNNLRSTKSRQCKHCKKTIHKSNRHFCNHRCSSQFKYEEFITNWRSGDTSKASTCDGLGISNYIRRYLFEKYDNKCCKCGWAKTNPVTGKIPLVVNHINGDSTNSKESNLELICPCCDSLTPTYMGLNKGKGREARRRKRQASR